MSPYNPSDAEMRSWAKTYDACRKRYEDDETDECIEIAPGHLKDQNMPRYFRLKFLILVAACLDDWHEAKKTLDTADTIWRGARNHYRNNADPKVEEALSEIRESLDSLREQHNNEAVPEDIIVWI